MADTQTNNLILKCAGIKTRDEVLRGVAPILDLSQMENRGFHDEHESSSIKIQTCTMHPGGMELGEMQGKNNGVHHNMELRKIAPKKPPNPWHRLKTVFLVVIIVLLIIWIVTYFTLSKFKVL
ncbi:hypothetical protein B566_EDAN010983 [Ephemera danica]|nr:hypothetical protein B566_EDAN010983 [Ephemera danica]